MPVDGQVYSYSFFIEVKMTCEFNKQQIFLPQLLPLDSSVSEYFTKGQGQFLWYCLVRKATRADNCVRLEGTCFFSWC